MRSNEVQAVSHSMRNGSMADSASKRSKRRSFISRLASSPASRGFETARRMTTTPNMTANTPSRKNRQHNEGTMPEKIHYLPPPTWSSAATKPHTTLPQSPTQSTKTLYFGSREIRDRLEVYQPRTWGIIYSKRRWERSCTGSSHSCSTPTAAHRHDSQTRISIVPSRSTRVIKPDSP